MPVTPIARLLSNGGTAATTYVSSLSRTDAIAAAISNTPTATAVRTTTITTAGTDIAMRTWDRIAPYTNSSTFTTVVPTGQTAPQFVWEATMLPGETRYFAMSYPFTPATTGTGMIVAATNFADNAHNYQVSIYDATGTTTLATSGSLLDGNVTTPSIGLTETAPYNWQTIRASSHLLTATLTEGTLYNIVVSYDAMNYLIPDSFPNPAGLAFMVDLWEVI